MSYWLHLDCKCLLYVGILPPTCYHGYAKLFYLPRYFLEFALQQDRHPKHQTKRPCHKVTVTIKNLNLQSMKSDNTEALKIEIYL